MTLQEIPSESFRERSIPVLETERLILRAPRLGDVKTVAALANDRRIAENTARIPHPYRSGDAEDFIAIGQPRQRHRVPDHAALPGRGDRRLRLYRSSTGIRRRSAIGSASKHWGKGYATEAVRAVIDHAFTDLDCEALQSAARVTNPASRRVLEKCGFQWTGAGLLAHPRARKLGADRPLPPRPRPVGLAQELGPLDPHCVMRRGLVARPAARSAGSSPRCAAHWRDDWRSALAEPVVHSDAGTLVPSIGSDHEQVQCLRFATCHACSANRTAGRR